MLIRDYRDGDIYSILKSKPEHALTQYVREDVLKAGIAFTGIDNNENIVGSGGLVELWPGVYEAWIALDERYKRDNLFVFRRLKDVLETMPSSTFRIHAHVNVNTENQEKLMILLGFEKEAVLENYFPDKANCVIYRRLY